MRLGAAVLLVATIALALLYWRSTGGPGPVDAGRPAPAASTEDDTARLATPPTSATSEIAVLEQRLFVHGSLRGAQLDGSWSVTDGRLLPSLALRRRFDQLLTTVGETSVEELGRLVRAQATHDVGPALAAEVMAIWDRYVMLQGQPATVRTGSTGVAALLEVFAEQRLRRRQILGPAWADAFFGDEETQLRSTLERAANPAAAESAAATVKPEVPPHLNAPGVAPEALHAQRVAAFGADAAARLAQVDRDEQAWEARLDAARAELARLDADPGLSPQLRAEAAERWLASHFDGREQVRVRALLQR